MKINRLIGIITTLQQKGKVTAPYLANKFEVSRRTINRDIEDICRAGIPIVTTQGASGGIALMEGFCIDTTVFTEEELQAVFIGLKSLDSISNTPKALQLTEKMGGVIPIADHMMIDLSSFYKDSLSEKIALLKGAIAQKRCVTFHYYYEKGEADKLIEPLMIVFKWSNWYIFGFSRERKDFRLYKLHRLWNLQITDVMFEPKNISPEQMHLGENITDDLTITAIYEPAEKYRLVEEYGPDSFCTLEDGRLYTQWGFSSYQKALQWYLGFGSRVRITAPEDFRQLYIQEIQKMLEQTAKGK